jgi:hypothetical protein
MICYCSRIKTRWLACGVLNSPKDWCHRILAERVNELTIAIVVNLHAFGCSLSLDGCKVALALNDFCGKYAFVIAYAACCECLACFDCAVRVVHGSVLDFPAKTSTSFFNYFHFSSKSSIGAGLRPIAFFFFAEFFLFSPLIVLNQKITSSFS